MRPRADEAHPAAEHVPELGQLVEAGLAQEAADPGHPVVVAGRLAAAADVGALGAHSAELGDDDDPAAGAEAGLAEEDRAGGIEPDRERDHRYQGRDREEQEEGSETVHHRLELPGEPAGRRGIGSLRRRLAACPGIADPGFDLRIVCHITHIHTQRPTTPRRNETRAPAGLRNAPQERLPVHDPGKAPLHGQIIGRVTPLTGGH